MVQLTAGNLTYDWADNWARLPDSESARTNGRTHGAAVTRSGQIVIFCQANPAVLFFSPEGKLVKSWGDRFLGAHGLTLVHEGDQDYLWLTDQNTAEVVKTTLDGETVLSLKPPALPAYTAGKFVPTWVAVNEESRGGNGDIWVADGYGMNYIHRYTRQGQYLGSINGEEGKAGAFKCPHGIRVDHRHSAPELYIADRGNRLIQVYDMDGTFKRVFGSDILTSPCCFVSDGDMLVVPELRARLALLDRDDKLIGYLGDNEPVCDIPGWPNHPADLIQPGKFNSPHGITADSAGNLYIVEWIIGGRITKLLKHTR